MTTNLRGAELLRDPHLNKSFNRSATPPPNCTCALLRVNRPNWRRKITAVEGRDLAEAPAATGVASKDNGSRSQNFGVFQAFEVLSRQSGY